MSSCRLTSVGSLAVFLLGFSACGGSFGFGDQNEEGESETRKQRASSACSAGDPCGPGEICTYDGCDEYVGSCEPLDSDEPTPKECHEEGYDPVCGCNDRVYYNACLAELSVPDFNEEASECSAPCQESADCEGHEYCHFPPGADCSSEDSEGTCLPRPNDCPDPELGQLGVCGATAPNTKARVRHGKPGPQWARAFQDLVAANMTRRI